MLVSCALGNAKVLSFALGDAKVPNANGFASQWNIVLRLNKSTIVRECDSVYISSKSGFITHSMKLDNLQYVNTLISIRNNSLTGSWMF